MAPKTLEKAVFIIGERPLTSSALMMEFANGLNKLQRTIARLKGQVGEGIAFLLLDDLIGRDPTSSWKYIKHTESISRSSTVCSLFRKCHL